MTKGYKGLLSMILILVFSINTVMTAFATETNQAETEKELTEEEKIMQAELEAAYKIPTESNSWEGWPKGPGTYGEAAIVMEADTGTILYAKDIDSKQYPASITKVLTALIAFENGDFSDQVTFSHDCVSFLQPGDSSVGLKEGNVITLEQTLYATLLASANEAAYAVGENVGKNAGHDYNWFIDQMNERVKELGGVNSHFANTNGLHDPDHYTCALDMALVGSELFKHSEFFEIVQTLEYKIPESETVEEHVFQQKHKMLKPNDPEYYKRVVGGKTGFTSDALSTLITMADNGKMKLVCVVLRTHGKNVYPDTRNLLKYAFKNFKKVDLTKHMESADVAEVMTEEAGAKVPAVVIPKDADFDSLDVEIVPDEADKTHGTVNYTYKGQDVGGAQVKFSDAYIAEHSPELLITETENKEKDEPETSLTETESEEGQAEKAEGIERTVVVRVLDKLGVFDKSRTVQIILAAASVLLVILVIAFVIMLIRLKIKRKRKRKRP